MNRTEPPLKWFSNAFITWEIRRFLIISRTAMLMSSPIMTLSGPYETKWRFYLEFSDKEHILKLKLEFLPDEIPLVNVQVHWASCILDEKDEGYYDCERIYIFNQKSSLVVEVIPIQDVFEMMELKRFDNLTIKCRMLVRCGRIDRFPPSRVEGIAGLSNDLYFLPTSFLHHDVTTTVNNVNFSLHKAMLYQRSYKIAKAIEQSTSDMKVNFNFYNINAAMSILNYIYTGDLNFILHNPNLIIPDHLEYLGIPELKDIYSQQKIIMISDVQFVGYGFRWQIAKFNEVINKTLYGPEFEVRSLKSSFRLSMTVTETEDNKKSLSVEAILLDSKRTLALTVEIDLKTDENKFLYLKRFSKILRVKDTVGGEIINTASIKGSSDPDLENIFDRKSLVINAEFYIRAGDVVCDIIEDVPAARPELTPEKSFGKLVRIMNNLFRSHDYSDFHFLINNEEIKAHKFLVAARSPIFKDLLKRNLDLISVKISDIQSDVFREFLSYIYMGIIRETDAIKLIELYNLGDQYKVAYLQRITSNIIMNLINEKNMLQVLIFANDKELSELKEKALDYAASKFDLLEDNPDIERLKSTKYFLYREIEKRAAYKEN